MDKRIRVEPKRPKIFRFGFYLNWLGFRFFIGILGNELHEYDENIYVEDV